MRELKALLIALALAVACDSNDPAGPSATECEAVREHVVELRLAAVAFPSSDPATRERELQKHRTSLRQTLGDRYVEQCRKRSSGVVACQVKARTLDDFQACNEA